MGIHKPSNAAVSRLLIPACCIDLVNAGREFRHGAHPRITIAEITFDDFVLYRQLLP
jgi:hypothetical protein